MAKEDRKHWGKMVGSPVIRVQRLGSYRTIITENGKWMVKEIHSLDRSKWWINVDQEMRKRGYRWMPRIVSDHDRWILTHWIEGRKADYRNKRDAEDCIRMLALFHRLGQKLPVHWQGREADLFHQRLTRRLKKFHTVVMEREDVSGKAGEILKKYGPSLYVQGLHVLHQLEDVGLAKYTAAARAERKVAHRDLANHNWVVDKRSVPWLIDFETASYDCQLGDLWQFLARVMSENKWDVHFWYRLLKMYDAIHPLTKYEKEVLRLLFAFPNEFYREMIGVVTMKSGYKPEYTLPYIKQLVGTFPQWRHFLRTVAKW
ncbi:phosphotransferase [Mechercharimyces sp. CAU 1602]|uniref:phosphotransferase n=1 Tax=Mechercharimyces sp. CAU 1602 TaxID=2973933 RepID=UPI00216364B9|nr:phosphotransferase [Mechercharimyces sp. CAU 1602]MCS1351423.1 phosphotransferase [Mechercharimyces sp. CAU 1602]